MKASQIENLGHSTFLVKVEGVSILTDPFLSDSAGGIKRVVPPARKPQELSPDIVLVSHAHYDHLDLSTIRCLGGDFTLVVPKGCGRLLEGFNFVELGDFESTTIGTVKITKVPARHRRGRSPFHPGTDVGGFVFSVSELVFYFAGDTAYDGQLYLEISERLPFIDVAMLPIGGFMPAPFRRLHQTPEEAVAGFRLLKAGALVPIHFGTWHLFPFYLKRERAVERLRSCSYICGLEERVFVVHPGERVPLSSVLRR
jgi:L-ascorbate metabolism protein UlaG (beta-lactamase superfamily)